MSNRIVLIAARLTSLLLLVSATNTVRAAATESDPWDRLPDILARIRPPQFPAREFVVTRFGAVAGTTTNVTGAFARAIEACATAGGGRVTVPPGVFRTGPIHLRSNVELHLSPGAELVFSDRIEDYLPPVFVRGGGIEFYNYSPLIYANGCTNVAVTGKGRLNGNARAWWSWKNRETRAAFEMGSRGVPVEQRVFGTEAAAIRPSFLCLIQCTNVLLEGFSIGSGPNWTIHPVYCVNTTIRGVTVQTDGPNNDGIDPDSCRDVLIEDCTFDTGDDCVVLKSGYNEDGWRVNRPTENVVMRRCFSRRGHGGLVIGSEMSGDVRNVFMYDCEFEGTDRAIRIKSRRGRGGVVENVFARNLKVRDMKHEVVILSMDYSADRNEAGNEKPPVFQNIRISDLQADGAPVAIRISGLEDSLIENVRFENLTIRSRQGVLARHVRNLAFHNANIAAEKGPTFNLESATGVVINNCPATPGTGIFVSVQGARSRDIRLEQCDISRADQPFILGEEVDRGAVLMMP